MKGILANLLIKLGLDSKEFEQGMGKAKEETKSFGSLMKNLGGMIAGAFAISSIVGFAKSLFAVANESIRVENELAAAIKANGKAVDANMAAYKAFAEEMQNISTVDDEATLSALRLAETLQSKAPIEATKNAIALSKAIGVDLNTAVKMAVMAQSDMYTMLGRYVPALREAGTEAERTAEYNKLLASGMQMVTAEMDTAQGKILQNQNAWENFKETLGSVISQSTILRDALNITSGVLTVLNGNLKWYDKLRYLVNGQLGVGVAVTNALAMAQSDAAKKAADEANAGIKLKKVIDETTESNKKLIKSKIEVGELQRNIGGKISGKTELPKFGGTPDTQTLGAGLPIVYENAIKDQQQKQQEWLDNFNSFKEQAAQMAVDFGTDVVHEFGMAIGEMLATGDFPADFGKNVLAAIGGFISQLGKMLIGLGVASEAFQKLLAGSFLAGGIPLIAAGAGLVLLGGAISGFAKAGPKATGSTSGSVSTPSYSGASGSRYNAQAQMNKVVFEIEGVKLKGVMNNVDRKYGLIR